MELQEQHSRNLESYMLTYGKPEEVHHLPNGYSVMFAEDSFTITKHDDHFPIGSAFVVNDTAINQGTCWIAKDARPEILRQAKLLP